MKTPLHVAKKEYKFPSLTPYTINIIMANQDDNKFNDQTEHIKISR